MNTIIVSSLSMMADAASAQGSNPMSLLVPVLLFGGMWFLMIAPQRKRQKQHEKMLQELSTGADVIAAGGICGTIAGVKDDRFILKINDTTKIEILKTAVQSKIEPKPIKA